jgi:hypothetical protein
MEQKLISQLPREAVERLIATLPFYKQVRQADDWQYELLLTHSRVMTYAPGESVLRKGEKDPWLYFLLKGQLVVLAGEEERAVNYVTPGEVFGDLALLLGSGRTATLTVDSACREVMVFATDFTVFGELEDCSRINLNTKLCYYQNLLHSLRWKLEVYRGKYPSFELADKHRGVKLYRGEKHSFEELCALHKQACELAILLGQWNQAFGRLSLVDGEAPSPQLLSAIGS